MVNELVQKIKKYNEAYRIGKALISDKEYDSLVEKLRQISPDNDWFKHVEPVPVSNSRKVKLPIPMRSLDKVKNIEELLSWTKNAGLSPDDVVVVTPKFDGISMLCNPKTGMAYSRGGDENEGQDCSSHMKATKALEKSSFHHDFPDIEFVYGELVFSKAKWKQHFENQISENGIKYKSPRNTVAGFINRDEATSLLEHVDFCKYGIDNPQQYFDTYTEVMVALQVYDESSKPTWGYNLQIKDLTTELLADLYNVWEQHYYIDGLVIYVNDLQLWNKLGRHQTTGNPQYAIAYKHPDFTATFATTVQDITWNISKAGAFKPVVNIDAVDTGDCLMENPTGYNAGWIADRAIGKEAVIKVTRSGGVIPKIIDVITPAPEENLNEMWDELSVCPHCGAPTKWDNNYIELYCTNIHCKGVKLAKAIFFFATVGAENIGEKIIAKMFESGFKSVAEMLNITYQDLMAIEGFGDGIADIIIQNMNTIKKGVELTTLMHASDCFVGIGKIKAKKILDEMSKEDLEEFLNMKYDRRFAKSDEKTLSITQGSFIAGVQPFYNFIGETKIPFYYNTEKPSGDKCNGFAVCFSGIRDSELEQYIINEGGRVVSGVSKNTTHLIVKDPNDTSSKIVKAKGLGVTILTIDQFKSL